MSSADSPSHRLRILFVEDHADTAYALAKLLQRSGRDVTTAATLGAARSLCGIRPFDLLICDIGLPDGEGWELAELARRCGARAIALTGFGMPEDVEHSRSAGFDAHVTKPVEFTALEAVIVNLCGPVTSDDARLRTFRARVNGMTTAELAELAREPRYQSREAADEFRIVSEVLSLGLARDHSPASYAPPGDDAPPQPQSPSLATPAGG